MILNTHPGDRKEMVRAISEFRSEEDMLAHRGKYARHRCAGREEAQKDE